MIENKIITITKKNTFDKGWTLFKPFDCGVTVNRAYKEIKLADIIRAITFADEVNLVLCETCLSSRVVAELEWVNKHIKLNVVIKSKSLLNSYSKLSFNTTTVDASANFNYIGISGKQTVRAIIADSFCEVDDTVENIYFKNKKASANFDFLKLAKTVFIADKDCNIDYTTLIAEAQKNKCKVNYVVSTKQYSRKVFDMAQKYGIELLVSDFVGSGVMLVADNNELFAINTLKEGVYISNPIRDAFSYFGKLFRCCFFPDKVSGATLMSNYYSCYNGKLEKLNVAQSKLIEIDVAIPLMKDFVEENFDKSICDKHNDYSAVAKQVEYHFTLTPPMFDESYTESHLYDGIHKLLADWQKIQTLDFKSIKNKYNDILKQDYGLLHCLGAAQQFTKQLTEMASRIEYTNYYAQVDAIHKLLVDARTFLLDILTSMFNEIYTTHSTTRFDKFDVEIDGYRQTIAEKTVLIEQGVDVLSNKRRVEILNKKINDLLVLKEKFVGSSSAVTSKMQEQFVERCKAILAQTYLPSKVINNESIENIVKSKEEKPEEKFDVFVENYLYAIDDYLKNCIAVLDELSKECIPETYPVYEKDMQRYIAIDVLDEYEQTKSMCKKFNILCLSRR